MSRTAPSACSQSSALKLDRVWWLVTPGNPLKDDGALHDLDERAEAARRMAGDPRIDVSCLESVIGTRYTVDTVRYLRRRASGLRFVWIMGADNLAQFHRWQNWRRIASEVPIAVIDRPPQSFRALGFARRTGTCALPTARKSGRQARRPACTGLGLSYRHEIEPVFNRSAEPGRQLEDKVTGRRRYESTELRKRGTGIETVNPTCIVWSAGGEGFGVRDTVKGMVPGHICIVQVCFTQGSQNRA